MYVENARVYPLHTPPVLMYIVNNKFPIRDDRYNIPFYLDRHLAIIIILLLFDLMIGDIFRIIHIDTGFLNNCRDNFLCPCVFEFEKNYFINFIIMLYEYLCPY